MEYKREELIALMREMEKQTALCHIRPQLAGAIADELERSEPVVHGHWVFPTVIGGYAWDIPHCSVCNGVPCGTDENTKYCAICGARMDGE